MYRQNIVVFTGAGISAESGLQTFRGVNGMWENYRVEEVASDMATVKGIFYARRFRY